MAKPHRLKQIAKEHDEPLADVILSKLNEYGTIDAAAHDLGIGFMALYKWVKKNGVEKRVVWVKPPEAEHAAS